MVSAGVSTLYLIHMREPFEAVEREILFEREDAEKPDLWEVVDSEHHALDKKRINSLKELVSVGFKLTIHGPYDPWINIADREPSRRRQSITRIKGSIDAAAELEAKSFNLHPGGYRGFNEDRKRLSIINCEAIASLHDYASSRGIFLSLENMPPNQDYFMVAPEEFLELKEKSGIDLKVTFDPGHANLAGFIDDFLNTLSKHILEVHVHDNRGELDEHLEVGLGSVNWTKIFTELAAKEQRVNYVLETYNQPFKSLAWIKQQLSALEKRFRFTRGI
ncbi:MAG: sugar phosphate isomerase/epimerase [Nitrososphaerales archaeon]